MKRALIVILLALPAFAAGDSDNYYRVEIIAFAHSSGHFDAWPVTQPDDFSSAQDPLWLDFSKTRHEQLADQEYEALDNDLRRTLEMIETISSIEQGQIEELEEILRPEPLRALDELSEPMRRAHNRLERSAGHEVLASLAWFQPLQRSGQPAVRLHDQNIIDVEWLELTPYGSLLRDGQPVYGTEGLFPHLYFRLDGRLRLRQGQFSHADLDLHWYRPSGSADRSEFNLHKLAESRAIRPGRLEYFDSSWLGVLLLLTPWTAETSDIEAMLGEGF